MEVLVVAVMVVALPVTAVVCLSPSPWTLLAVRLNLLAVVLVIVVVVEAVMVAVVLAVTVVVWELAVV
jgi:hypothetical protein